MNVKELICIGCPRGCKLEVEMKDNEIVNISGHSCKKGLEYGEKEVTNPTRTVSSSVLISGGDIDVLPVKTEKDVPKDKILDIVKELKNISVDAPVNVGDVIIYDILGTGVNIVSTQKVEESYNG